LLCQCDIRDGLPLLRAPRELVEDSQGHLGIASIKFEMTDSSLNLDLALGSKYRQSSKGVDVPTSSSDSTS
jgi:hypothetical protein